MPQPVSTQLANISSGLKVQLTAAQSPTLAPELPATMIDALTRAIGAAIQAVQELWLQNAIQQGDI